ncbi:coiled-coil domain-containing protein 106-like [Synchiropus splendidus]|uniref:coiled-coil domain-containing protein 106-like n=1 Tax=Synchiropus splendidus TaxID=270530 RepID=UPI00237ED3CD|nr:coiled-coil domain-containing protein 106-like [Synchiropus splendidus]XP_053719452.1 coiled-coil domain-containing protein 106-like [Synchiropus splendidus]
MSQCAHAGGAAGPTQEALDMSVSVEDNARDQDQSLQMNEVSMSHSAPAEDEGALRCQSLDTSYPEEENQTTNEGEEQQESFPCGCTSMIQVINLRTNLVLALEKNAWMQKCIAELEEERNFLRLQLDRLISNISFKDPSAQVCSDQEVVVKTEPASSTSCVTTRSGMSLQDPGEYRSAVMDTEDSALEREHCDSKLYVKKKEEDELWLEPGAMKGHGGVRLRNLGIAPRFERQRVKNPDGVLHRYKKILTTFQHVRSISRSLRIHGIDRNTLASTNPIAELLLVAPEKMAEVGEFDSSKEKLLEYARRCYASMDEQMHAKIKKMKNNNKLLPITYRFRKS